MKQLFIVGLMLALNAVGAEPKAGSGVISFEGRTINVNEFLEAFPYDQWRIAGSLAQKKLFLMKLDGNKQNLHRLDLNDSGKEPALIDTTKAAATEDFSKSLSFYWDVLDRNGHLYFIADEQNNEKFNLHRLDPETGVILKLSNVNYVSGFGFNEDETLCAYLERTGNEGARFKLHLLNLETLEDKVIASDTAEEQMTWSKPAFSPSGKTIALTTLKGGDRTKGNISIVSTEGKEDQKPQVLTPEAKRTFPEAAEDWVSEDEVVFRSNEKGAGNIYLLNVKTKAIRQLTDYGSDVDTFFIGRSSGKPVVVYSVKNPLGSQLFSLDLSVTDSKPQRLTEAPASITIIDAKDDSVLLDIRSATQILEVASLSLSDPKVQQRAILNPATSDKVVQCDVKPVLYDTFDKVPMTLGDSKTEGKIHAFLYTPKNPLPKDKQMVLIESFYGGENQYTMQQHLLCAGGVHVLSPAARGGAAVSAEYELLNDGDLGGKEVLDVSYGGKYVSELLGIPASRIGVYGHSHGGYEVMRQLTADKIEGHSPFAWGFGVALSGFPSIKQQYEASNIKQWIAKEAGDPTKPGVLEQWEERSPINHTKNLKGKMLIIHGTNDQRTPFPQAQAFYDKLKADGKESLVTFVPLEGAGHAYVARKDIIQQYESWFSFLETIE